MARSSTVRLMGTLMFAGAVLFSIGANADPRDAEILHRQGAVHIVLVDAQSSSRADLSSVGRSVCRSVNGICVIWLFNDKSLAMEGIRQAKMGNVFDPMPGMIGIYSRNNTVNELICYDLAGTC